MLLKKRKDVQLQNIYQDMIDNTQQVLNILNIWQTYKKMAMTFRI